MSTIQRLPKDAWSLARPYFWSEERWSARAKLAGIVALSLALVGMDVVLSYWGRAFYNALQQKDWDSFIALLLTYKQDENGFLPGFIGLAVVYITASIYATYLNQWLQISWREWITGQLLQDWLAERAYYAISLRAVSDPGTTDNPDQRIAEDLRDYVTQTLSLSLNLLSTIVTLFSFVTILWTLSGPVSVLGITIPGYMVWAALVYSAIGTALVHLIGRPLVNLNFRQQGARERRGHRALGRRDRRARQARPAIRRHPRQLARHHDAHQAAQLAGRRLQPDLLDLPGDRRRPALFRRFA